MEDLIFQTAYSLIPSIVFDGTKHFVWSGRQRLLHIRRREHRAKFSLEVVMQLRGKIQPLKTDDPSEVIVSILLLIWC